MLFVTNRVPREDTTTPTALPRKISFDPQNTDTTNNMYFCEWQARGNYSEIGSAVFFDALRKLSNPKSQILIYIHGFNNTAENEIFPRAAKLKELLGDDIEVIPTIWPCDDDAVTALVDDYWDDQRAAKASGVAYARLLGKFDKWQKESSNKCLRRINILSHSMGNLVLEHALDSWTKGEGYGQMSQICRNIFMVAADVKNGTLQRGNRGQYIPDAAKNVVVYYAGDDLAMSASKVSNLKNISLSRRLGMTGPERMKKVPKNVYEVNCDKFNNSMDRPAGHSYFLDNDKVPSDPKYKISPVIEHMKHALKFGNLNPNERSHVLPKP